MHQTMQDQSIRKVGKCELRLLALVMGFEKCSLEEYSDRWVRIQITSGKTVKGVSGKRYKNTKTKGEKQ